MDSEEYYEREDRFFKRFLIAGNIIGLSLFTLLHFENESHRLLDWVLSENRPIFQAYLSPVRESILDQIERTYRFHLSQVYDSTSRNNGRVNLNSSH